MQPQRMERTIGPSGAAATLVGYVVGASIFILPGELAPSTGPAVVVAFLLASMPALFSCFVTAQIACAFPVSGASYVAVSRVLSPFWGFLVVWCLLLGVTVGVALIAYGLADYFAFFFPGADPLVVALAAVLGFGALNLLGAKPSVGSQTVLAAGFLLVLLVFVSGGLYHLRPEHLSPFFPRGIGPVAAAAVPAYFSYIGFFMLAELGEEIRDPERTIPRALGASFLVVVFFYTLVPLVLVGVVPWEGLDATRASIGAAAAVFLPEPLPASISIGALLAAATSLNGILLAVSRDVLALARDRIFPEALGRIHGRFLSPAAAIAAVSALGLAGVLVGTTIRTYAVVAVSAIMMVHVLTAAAVLLMPARAPDRFRASPFRLPRFWRVSLSLGLAASSALFIVLGAAESLGSALAFAALVLTGGSYYALRKRSLERRGLRLEDLLAAKVTDR